MVRRELLGTLTITALGLGHAVGRVAGTESEHHRDEVHEACLKHCQACKRECDQAFHDCYTKLAERDKQCAEALHFVADCAALCDLSGTLIARRSPLILRARAAHAEACQDCGAGYDTFNGPELKHRAKNCRDCEGACRSMVKSLGGQHHKADRHSSRLLHQEYGVSHDV
jgi:hypothetical protein